MTDDGIITDGLTTEERAELRQDFIAPGEWEQEKNNGRQYTFLDGDRARKVFRQGDETIESALARARANPPKRAGARKRKPDPRPDTGAKKTGPPEPTDSDLQSMLEELLSLPALPAAVVLHCEYCATHFAKQAKPTATQIVMLSKGSPGLRRNIVTIYRAWTSLTYGGILLAYVGKPMLHHLAPAETLAQVGPFVGVPPRPDAAEQARWGFMPPHAHPDTPPVTNRPRPANNAATTDPEAYG